MSMPDNLPPLPPGVPPLLVSSNSLSSSHTLMYPSVSSAMDHQQMSAVYYQQHQQYYQQCMYMYAAAAAATTNTLPVQQTLPAYCFNTQQTQANHIELSSMSMTNQIEVIQNGTNSAQQPHQQQHPHHQKPAIKFNLKFQGSQNKATPNANGNGTRRKSRFHKNNSLSNITAEQNEFKQQNEENSPKACKSAPIEAAHSAATLATSAADIVSDIKLWPGNLRAYCTKVYQFYQQQKQNAVSEDQVTKYLQQRITDTFKHKPDLHIDWDSEQIPDVTQIRLVAPFSVAQLEQQKRQKKVTDTAIAAAKARAVEILAEKELTNKKLTEMRKQAKYSPTSSHYNHSQPQSSHVQNNSNKRKYSKDRSESPLSTSSSSSSSSFTSTSTNSSSPSSDSSDEFIPFSRKNGAKKAANTAMHRVEKEKLKSIEINQATNSKRFQNHKFEVSSNHEQRRHFGQLLASDEETENEKDLEQMKLLKTPNKFLSNKQKKLKSSLINRQKRFQLKGSNFKQGIHQKKQTNRQNVRTLFSSTTREIACEDANMSEVCTGLNQDLEKEYLRLTGPPEPIMIRPLEVLKKSLVHVLNKYAKSNDYRYICDQMKAIRQDLTVQVIRNEFTIEVYETHARIAIKNKDRDEFNQCQSQLKILYSQLETNGSPNEKTNSAEFIGYRLLYNMLTKSHTDLNEVIKEIKRKYSTNHYLNHLLALRNAWHLNNHVKFFRLYKQCNELSKCLIDLFLERERKSALKLIIKAYRPSIRLECVKEMLAYDSIQKCKEDLLAYKLSVLPVPLTNESSSSSCSSNNLPKNNPSSSSSSKTIGLKNKIISKQLLSYEDVLDCKSCTVQF